MFISRLMVDGASLVWSVESTIWPVSAAFTAISAVATLTLFSFLGLESACVPANEVENPAVTIPRATIIGTVVAAVGLADSNGA